MSEALPDFLSDTTVSFSTRARLLASSSMADDEMRAFLMKLANYYEAMLCPHLRAAQRIAVWLRFYPDRRATHAVIGSETGLSRETVTREIKRAREIVALKVS